MVLVGLTGDERWLHEPFRPTRAPGPGDHDSGGLPEATQHQVRDAAHQAVLDYRAGKLVLSAPDEQDLVRMLDVALGEDIPSDYGPLLAGEFDEHGRAMSALPAGCADGGFRVLIIGCGVAGICAAVALGAAGISYTVVDKNTGGRWSVVGERLPRLRRRHVQSPVLVLVRTEPRLVALLRQARRDRRLPPPGGSRERGRRLSRRPTSVGGAGAHVGG